MATFAVFYLVELKVYYFSHFSKLMELKASPEENLRTRKVRHSHLHPYIAPLVTKCLTLTDQYFRKLLLVSFPISQANEGIIAMCVFVCARIRLEFK